jgi:hypothetical protein
MYATCLFCHGKLGTNRVLESFPVGRRLAYDAAKGRLWVVCARCGRWNLSPLEERWEALEDCERLFRQTRLRSSTDNVGLARLADGTELVRIGRPQRPEFAAWRYGSRFGSRYRSTILQAAVGPAVAVAAVAGGPALLPLTVPAALVFPVAAIVYLYRRQWGVLARIASPSGERSAIRGHHLKSARLVPSSESSAAVNWNLSTQHDGGSITVRGEEAMWLLGKILARINRVGGGQTVMERAVERLENEGGSARLFERIATQPPYEDSRLARWWYETGDAGGASSEPGTLRSMPVADRLALEMASHEEAERRAMEGELQALEAAWREAEEIAGIADSLALPAGVNGLLARHQSARNLPKG